MVLGLALDSQLAGCLKNNDVRVSLGGNHGFNVLDGPNMIRSAPRVLANSADVNMTNTQYFIYYSPHPEWAFGMSPNFTVNWNAAPENQMTFPIGFGFNKTFYFGELPVAIGAEWYYAIASPEYAPASSHTFRVYVMPVFPVPWSDLARLIREKMP